MQFRKKPVIIEAEQYRSGLEDGFEEVDGKLVPFINTLEDTDYSKHYITEGDWIITGVKKERYPCKPDIFEMTYEKVD
jgi:hypothetical protein